MSKYISNGFRAVDAENITAAAEIFATRAARREFGKRGHARTCTMGSHSADGRLAEFSAFIGRTAGRNETTGHNIHLTVRRA
jgi:hypothetical protein